MFCAGRPSMFGAMPLFEIDPSMIRNGNRPLSSQPIMGLIHDVLGNGTRFEDLLRWNQPNCVDRSGHRHCRTHCYGHRNPVDLLEQLIIEETIRDAHQMCKKKSDHQCRKEDLMSNEEKRSETLQSEKENNITENIEITKSSPHETVTTQSKTCLVNTGCECNIHKDHQCEKVAPESNESRKIVLQKEENDTNRDVDVTKISPNHTVVNQSEPWSVSIDMNGCDEVRARAEGNKIVVEGHTQNSEGFMTIKRVMTLPRNVKVEALSATLGKSGTLTLTETQANKENQVTDIQVLKENTQEFSNIEQFGRESTQDNIMQKDTSDVNMDDSNISNK